MAVLGYVPQFVEQQYVPTQDVGLLSNILGQKQQQYNQASQMQAGALADIYGREVTSGFEPAAQERIKSFETKLQELTDRRGGDLGAAIGDISGAIGSMYKDPFWKSSGKAVEYQKQLDQMLAKNPNLMVLNRPSDVSYKEGLSEEDLRYNVLDPEEARKRAIEELSFLDKERFAGIRTTPEGLDVVTYAKGPSGNEINNILKDPKYTQRLQELFPQTKSMDEGAKQEFFKNTLKSAAESYQGVREREIGYNPYFKAQLEADKKRKDYASSGLSVYHNIQGQEGAFNQIDNNSKLVNLGFDEQGNFNKEYVPENAGIGTVFKREGLQAYQSLVEPLVDIGYNIFTGTNTEKSNKPWSEKKLEEINISDRKKAENLFNKSKEKYSMIYDAFKESGKSERDFINKVIDIETKNAVKMTQSVGLNLKEGLKDIKSKLSEVDKPAFIDSEGKEISRSQLEAKAKKMKISDSDLYNRQIMIDGTGSMFFELPEKEGSEKTVQYRVNSASLSSDLKPDSEVYRFVKRGFNNYQLDEGQLDKLQKAIIEVAGNNFRFWVNPNDETDRRLFLIDKTGEYAINNNGEPVEVPAAYLQMLDAKSKIEGLSTYNK